jgi:hypothetical protein
MTAKAQASSPDTGDTATPDADFAAAIAILNGATDKDGQSGQWVQLAAMPTAKRAEQAWQDAEQRGGGVLHNVGHQVQKADLGTDKGVVYRLRAGPIESVENARSLCSELKSRGIDCFLVHS